MKKNAGITLVALVITIIILLILAGVAISMITGGEGLFAQANGAATKYNQAAKNESDLINQLLGGEYLKGEETRQLSDMVKDGTIKVGDWIDYPIGLGTGTNNGEFTITPEQTGYSEEQKFNVSTYTGGWRVLYADSETGDIEIVSADNLLSNEEKTDLTLYGFTGYEHLIRTLNTMSSYYVNPLYANYARGIDTDRSADSFGSDQEAEEPRANNCLGNDKEAMSSLFGSSYYESTWNAFKALDLDKTNSYDAYWVQMWMYSCLARSGSGTEITNFTEVENSAPFKTIVSLKNNSLVRILSDTDGSSQEKAWKLK